MLSKEPDTWQKVVRDFYWSVRYKLLHRDGLTGNMEFKECGCILEENYTIWRLSQHLGRKRPLLMWSHVSTCEEHEREGAGVHLELSSPAVHNQLWHWEEEPCNHNPELLQVIYDAAKLDHEHTERVRAFLKSLPDVRTLKAVKSELRDEEFWIDSEIHEREVLASLKTDDSSTDPTAL